jgi:hypothetical protein
LKISASSGLKLAETAGEYVRRGGNGKPNNTSTSETQLIIPLGNIQYGQSRDILLKYDTSSSVDKLSPTICAELQCRPLDESRGIVDNFCSIMDTTDLPSESISYHQSRSMICSFLSTIAPLSAVEEHTPLSPRDILGAKQLELEVLLTSLPAAHMEDEMNQSLVEDLTGQIRLALANKYFDVWGKHFLQSIHGAHSKQLCNSFKDPGPLQYGKDSELFKQCRDKLDHIFDTIPPPTPSLLLVNEKRAPVSMSKYHDKYGSCFAAECLVRLADDTKVPVSSLKPDVEVWTVKGGRKVVAVVATAVDEMEMCRIGELIITLWHPICVGQDWIFPSQVANSPVTYTGVIYSLLLEAGPDSEAHGVEVGGYLATTLGHGVTPAGDENDARGHAFFGNYRKVLESLKGLGFKDGVYESRGVERNEKTGLVCGFSK